EPFELRPGPAVLDDEIATLDVTEITQSLEESLSHMLTRGPACAQVTDSSDLGRVLGVSRSRAEEPTEEQGDSEDETQPHHLDSGPSNSLPRCPRIGLTSLWSRPRSLTRFRRRRSRTIYGRPTQCR